MLPALQRLSYAGKQLDDAQRTLEQYGVAQWAAKVPNWPLKIRKREQTRACGSLLALLRLFLEWRCLWIGRQNLSRDASC